MTELPDPPADLPWRRQLPYRSIVAASDPDASYPFPLEMSDGYYLAAKYVLLGLNNCYASDDYNVPTEPHSKMLSAGLYLVRHFVELSLKYALFHAGQLTNDGKNRNAGDWQVADPGHSLSKLWMKLKGERVGRMSDEEWIRYDTAFIDSFVAELEQHDANAEAFRYPAKRVGEPVIGSLIVDPETVLRNLDHFRNVIWGIDQHFVNTFGMNVDYAESVSDPIDSGDL
jgi:hypothetical protein